MTSHDDYIDALTFGEPPFITPVWYMMKGDDLIGALQQHVADTWQYRRAAEAKYPDCVAWTKNHLGWCSMPTNNMRCSIWAPGTPPDVVLMAKLLEI